MFGSNIQNKLKNLDSFKKLPKDLSEPTLSGALISILSTAFMIFLFLTELSSFLTIQTSTEMNVDTDTHFQQIKVNMDIIFPNIPCDILSVDIMDVMGEHQVHTGEQLLRNRLDRNQKIIEQGIKIAHSEHSAHYHSEFDMERFKKGVSEKEGCQLYGYLLINKVPGNFHISAHAFHHILRDAFIQTGLQTLDLTHIINHLSFGDKENIDIVKKKFDKGILNPLDQTSVLNQGGHFFDYYLKVIPTTYHDINQNQYKLHQFTAHFSSFYSQTNIPAVWFKYDLSPMYVTFKQHKKSFLHFLVEICAIIGGIFSVAGIIDAIVHKSMVTILKKAQMGKLS